MPKYASLPYALLLFVVVFRLGRTADDTAAAVAVVMEGEAAVVAAVGGDAASAGVFGGTSTPRGDMIIGDGVRPPSPPPSAAAPPFPPTASAVAEVAPPPVGDDGEGDGTAVVEVLLPPEGIAAGS